MRNDLQTLLSEIQYLERVACLGNSYAFWRKIAANVIKMSKVLLVDRPMSVWFEDMIRGLEAGVDFYENKLSNDGYIPFNHGTAHQNILWYFNNSPTFRKKDYKSVLKVYRRIVRILKSGNDCDLFKNRIKEIKKMLKDGGGRVIRHH